MNRLVAIESPSSPVASPVASRNSASPGAGRARRCCAAGRGSGNGRSGLRVKSPVIVSWLLTIARLSRRRCSFDSASALGRRRRGRSRAAARRRRRRCAPHGSAPGVSAMRTWLIHRAALLRQAGHVEHGDALAFEMRRHAEQRADRHDAGAADAGDEDAVGLGRAPGSAGSGSGGSSSSPSSPASRLLQRAALDRDEARAEALDAGVILVAARLVDRALAAEFGLDRHDRQAVRRASSNRRSLRRPAR